MKILLIHSHGGGTRFSPVYDSTCSARLAAGGDAVAAVQEYLGSTDKQPRYLVEIPYPTTSLVFRDIQRVDSWEGHWIIWGDAPQAGDMTPHAERNQDSSMELVVDGEPVPICDRGDAADDTEAGDD